MEARLDLIASSLDGVDSYELCDIMSAISNCRKEPQMKRKTVFTPPYFRGDAKRNFRSYGCSSR